MTIRTLFSPEKLLFQARLPSPPEKWLFQALLPIPGKLIIVTKWLWQADGITATEITVPSSLAEPSVEVASPPSFSWRVKRDYIETVLWWWPSPPEKWLFQALFLTVASASSRMSCNQTKVNTKLNCNSSPAEKYREAVCCWSGKYFPWTKCPAWTEENK